ncbi:MAG: methyltransferase domain-containing protein, partial [Gemmatimonadota bacterium]|jgi:predicted TPR repeat methyltransferase|nr:methyltransferase domain-containing protein [Gemmatimonadota bacterium]
MRQKAIMLAPDVADLYYNLANAVHETSNPELAIAVYRKAIELSPAHANASHRVGLLLHAAGREEEAIEVVRQWTVAKPENPVAAHLLASMTGENVPQRASDDAVREMFNSFARSFDQVLTEQLNYRAPALIGDALAAILPAVGALDVLDAGCGTGLCAPYFRPFARSLVGIDLSPEMLFRARDRGGYDVLREAEITEFLRDHPDSFDLIGSADTLVYFGDLSDVLGAAATALRPGGYFVATFERLDGNSSSNPDGTIGWRIGHHGRYLHQESYLRQVLRDAGFEVIAARHEIPRTESGKDVEGILVTARATRRMADQ